MVMEQVLKRIGNSYMLSVSPKSIKKNKIDKTTKLEQLENDEGTGIISFRIIRPQKLVFPKIKGKLKLSPEIETLINEPVFPTDERLKDPRIQHLLYEDFC